MSPTVHSLLVFFKWRAPNKNGESRSHLDELKVFLVLYFMLNIFHYSKKTKVKRLRQYTKSLVHNTLNNINKTELNIHILNSKYL